LEGNTMSVSTDGGSFDILPEEVEVRVQARSGFAVASEGAYLAALVTDLTPELLNEGLAREFVRRVQDLRKQADLDIADRIRLYYSASTRLAAAVEANRSYIMSETLAVEMTAGNVPLDAAQTSDTFDGEEITAAIKKAA
jgi:isoleucyl-tRNA synthetase